MFSLLRREAWMALVGFGALCATLLGACDSGPTAVDLSQVVLSPSTAFLSPGETQQFSVTATLEDGSTESVPVNWSATGGSIDSSGLYTAGQNDGTFEVVATDTGSGLADAATVTISQPPPPGSFPQAYSLSRPLLQNNPGALLAGEDWQGMSSTSDLNGYGFFINKYAANTSGQGADASTVDVPYTPGAKRAEIVSDPTFGRTSRLWQTDRSDGDEHTVYYGRSNWSPADKCWLRVTVKYQRGFTTDGPGGGASAWKMVFGPSGRSWVWTNTNQMQHNVSEDFGGSYIELGDGQGFGYQETTEWSGEEWWEYIVYSERVSGNVYRKRFWSRELTSNGQIVSDPANATWKRRWGLEYSGASVPTGICDGLQLGINRNKQMFNGDVQWWKWGPWEIIDGDVIPDPYGLAQDML